MSVKGVTGKGYIGSHHNFNSLAPGKFEWNFRHVIFKQILAIDGWGISCEIALIWMSLDFINDQSTLVQVMAWCRQADLCRHMASPGHNELTWSNITSLGQNELKNFPFKHCSIHHTFFFNMSQMTMSEQFPGNWDEYKRSPLAEQSQRELRTGSAGSQWKTTMRLRQALRKSQLQI